MHQIIDIRFRALARHPNAFGGRIPMGVARPRPPGNPVVIIPRDPAMIGVTDDPVRRIIAQETIARAMEPIDHRTALSAQFKRG